MPSMARQQLTQHIYFRKKFMDYGLTKLMDICSLLFYSTLDFFCKRKNYCVQINIF